MSQRKAGAVLSYVGLVVNAVVSFVYVPLLLGFLTTEEYGVYELIGSIIAYLSVMDMGLSTTLNRFYVREKTAGSERGVENLLAMAAVIYGVLTVLAVAAGLAFDRALDPLYSESFTADELALAHQMMLLVILNCAVVLPGNWFLALINANERFVFARSLSIAKYLLQVAVVVAVLSWRASALGVLAVQVACNALAVGLYVTYVRKVLRVRARLHRWDWPLFQGMFAFSFFMLLNMVFDQIFWKTGQVILGVTCGAASVAVYGIACKLITAGYMQVSTGVTSVFLPKLTAISARTDDMSEINGLFNRIGRIQAILVWGVMAAFAAIGREFIYLWAGSDFSEAYAAVLILMAGLSVSLIQNLGISVLQAKNRLGFRAVVYIVLALLDVVLSIPVSAAFGVTGCSAVAAVLLFVGTGPVINVYYHRVIGVDIPGFWRGVLPLAIPAAVSGLVTASVVMLVPLAASWAAFAAHALAFVIAYALLLWLFWADDYEKGFVRSAVARIPKRKSR